jgi:hypothetical protein
MNVGNQPCNRPASTVGCSDGQTLAYPSHEARNMDRDSVTKDQAKTINASVQPSLGYLYRLRERMVKTGFPPNDPLLKLVDRAYDSMHRLFVELHYLSCYGVGRPSESDSKKANGAVAGGPVVHKE